MSVLDDFFKAGPSHIPVKKTIPVIEVKKHARLGASGAHRWSICHLAPRLEDGRPDNAGDGAKIGTICHDLGEQCLKAGDDLALSMALGKNALVTKEGLVVYRAAHADGGHTVTEDMIDWAAVYIDFVRKLQMAGGKLMVEVRVSIEHITDEPDAMGTSDSALIFDDEIVIVDLKCGFKRVYVKQPLRGIHLERAPESMQLKAQVSEVLKPNVQLVMYGEAVLEDLRKTQPEVMARIKRIRYIIVQPTLNHIDEHTVTVDEHSVWVQWLREQAAMTRSPFAEAYPDSEQCQYCKAYPCQAAEQKALMVAFDGFAALDEERVRQPSIDELPKIKRLLPMLENYIAYINARIHGELASGRKVPGYKLVPGDQGDRKWADPETVKNKMLMAGVSRHQIVDEKLKSPAQIEKLTKGRFKLPEVVKVWADLGEHIKRAPATSNKVVEDIDPRDGITVDPAAGFDFEGDSGSAPDNSFATSFFNV